MQQVTITPQGQAVVTILSAPVYAVAVQPAVVTAVTITGATIGTPGPAGANGTNGTNGVGVPVGGTTGQVLAKTSNADYATGWTAAGSGSGTVSSVSVTTANGVSGTVANPSTTPAISLSLGAITPSSVASTGAVTGTNLSGTNTGDQDLSSYATTSSVTTGLAGKEPTVTAGTSAQYYRGDKTMQTLNQDAVPSGTTNKAYTATEQTKLAAISGTNTGDETSSTIKTKLGITTLSGSNTGDQTLPTTLPPNGAASGDLSGSYPSPTVAKINGTALSGLSTGILKNTTTTGVPSIAIAADFPTLNQNTTGSAASFTGSLAGDVTGTQGATVVGKLNGTALSGLATGLLKNTTTTGVPTIATAGTDYVVPSGSITGSAATLTTARTIGTLTGDVTSAGSTFNGSANNTNATVVGKINGVALSGLATGILKNTTTTGVPSIAVAADFPTLNQNTTGSAASITGSITESQVTNLTTDLAGKQATLVSATNIKTINGSTLLGSGDLTVAGGSATPAGSNTQIQFNNSSAFGASANLVWDGTRVGVNYTGASAITTTSLGIGSIASYVSGAITSELTIGARTASSTGLTIVAASSQTADFIKLTDVFGNVVLSIPASGIPSFTGGINTGASGMQVQGGNYYQVKTTGNDFEIYNASGGDVPFYATSAGQHGIGTASPTANLHLKAGTASANTAPLKLTSGTVLTTTEAGAIEYDGSHLFFTAANGGTRYQLDQQSVGGSGITRSVSTVSGATSAGSTASTDYVYNVTATATLTLPTAIGNTNKYTVTNTAAGTTTTIATTSSQTINGSTTAVFSGQYISYDLVSDGANWFIR